jgi:hypothetical protein
LYSDSEIPKKNQELFNKLQKAGVNVKWVDTSDFGSHDLSVDEIEIEKNGIKFIIGWDVRGFNFELHGKVSPQDALKINYIIYGKTNINDNEEWLSMKDAFNGVLRFVKTDLKTIKIPGVDSKEYKILKSLGFKPRFKGSEKLYYYVPGGLSYQATPSENKYEFRYTGFGLDPLISFKTFEEFITNFEKYAKGKYPNENDVDPLAKAPEDDERRKTTIKYGGKPSPTVDIYSPFVSSERPPLPPISLNEIERLQQLANIKKIN